MKAATINSHHTCNMSDGQRAHIGGPLLKGSKKVLIENQMTVFKGCKLFCNSADVPKITTGSSKVFIENKAAARKGDATSHNSKIKGGTSKVLIGG